MKAVRLGVLTTVSLAAVTPGAAAEAATGSRVESGAATMVTEAHSYANRAHTRQFDESFEIRQFGPSVAAAAYNRAVAVSAGCSLDDSCRSIALSFQILATSGRSTRLINATNVSRAANQHCEGCETFSGAYQFVIATPRPFTLTSQQTNELADIHRQAEALKQSDDTIPIVRDRADALADQVMTILRHAVASAPRGTGSDPLDDFRPTVTMHRHVS